MTTKEEWFRHRLINVLEDRKLEDYTLTNSLLILLINLLITVFSDKLQEEA